MIWRNSDQRRSIITNRTNGSAYALGAVLAKLSGELPLSVHLLVVSFDKVPLRDFAACPSSAVSDLVQSVESTVQHVNRLVASRCKFIESLGTFHRLIYIYMDV